MGNPARPWKTWGTYAILPQNPKYCMDLLGELEELQLDELTITRFNG